MHGLILERPVAGRGGLGDEGVPGVPVVGGEPAADGEGAEHYEEQ